MRLALRSLATAVPPPARDPLKPANGAYEYSPNTKTRLLAEAPMRPPTTPLVVPSPCARRCVPPPKPANSISPAKAVCDNAKPRMTTATAATDRVEDIDLICSFSLRKGNEQTNSCDLPAAFIGAVSKSSNDPWPSITIQLYA